MTDCALPKGERNSLSGCGEAGPAGRRGQRTILLAILVGTLIPMVAAGCGMSQTMVVTVDPASFKSVVLESKQPVLINFYKDG
jgi:hypothetical protein